MISSGSEERTFAARRDFRSDKSEETSDPNTLAADCSTQNNKKVKRANNCLKRRTFSS
jgi:hypothetical protein